ncbi:MAG: hypothetical protein JNK04_02110 [Myxococcales bacterium]|nr:hypothetical protein [Myxococcales bacterium]
MAFGGGGGTTCPPTPDLIAGDCKRPACEDGVVTVVPDDLDLPPDDGQICTEEGCSGGEPTVTPTAAGTACGNDVACDGQGNCSGCLNDDDCPSFVECGIPNCNEEAQCGISPAPAGTPCTFTEFKVCDPVLGCVDCVDAATSCGPSTECLSVTCEDGACVYQEVDYGDPCLSTPGNVCSAIGTCVECVTAADCSQVGDDCHSPACSPSGGSCTLQQRPTGLPCLLTPGGVCDATGQCVECVEATDCPIPDDCTSPSCQDGVCTGTPVPDGNACLITPDQFCDSSGACVPCAEPCESTFCAPATCPAGVCTVTPLPFRADCPGGKCDENGECVECMPAFLDCPYFGPAACTYSVCVDNVCVLEQLPDGAQGCAPWAVCLNGTCTGCLNTVESCNFGTICCPSTYTCLASCE